MMVWFGIRMVMLAWFCMVGWSVGRGGWVDLRADLNGVMGVGGLGRVRAC